MGGKSSVPAAGGDVSLAGTFAGLDLGSVICNSANPFATSTEDLLLLQGSAAGAVTTRTICPGFVHDDKLHKWAPSTLVGGGGGTINCFGYSPHDLDYYLKALGQFNGSKPAVLSITGSSAEVAGMLRVISDAAPALPCKVAVEINMSCPNIPGHAPPAYEFDVMKTYLTDVFSKGDYGVQVGLKMPPYFYDPQYQQAADVVNQFKGVAFCTCINTVGNGFVIDVEKEEAVVPAGYGGLGGPAVHSIALGNVRKMRATLRKDIAVIGVGGVDSGEAAFRHLLCGASAIMVASALLKEGVGVLAKIESELRAIMAKKGYKSIADFQGKLSAT